MRQIERVRQPLDLARLARGLRAQAVIDGDGDEPRTARDARGASARRATSARRNPGRRRPRARAPARPSSPRTDCFASLCRDRGIVVVRHSSAGLKPEPVAGLHQRPTLALNPLLLTIDGRFDAGRGARIFPRHLAERGAGGFLLLQRRQRLAEPQQRIRRLAPICRIWWSRRGRLRRRRDIAGAGR